MLRWHLGVAVVLVLLGAVGAAAWGGIPARPAGERYLWDPVGVLDRSRASRVESLQRESLERYNSPLVVVVVQRAGDFGASSIEGLARSWFDAWQIGTLGLQRGANQGILLIVAVQDRRARIELGGDWGSAWDDRAQEIMREDLVPAFRRGDYAGGVAAGVERLAEMARLGPHSHPPGDRTGRGPSGWSPSGSAGLGSFRPDSLTLAFVLGVALVVLGLYWGNFDLVKLGVVVVLCVVFLPVFVFIGGLMLLFLVLASCGRRSGSSGGGRGYSGGYSGGGGASGSW